MKFIFLNTFVSMHQNYLACNIEATFVDVKTNNYVTSL